MQWLTFLYLSNCYGSPNPYDILFIGSDSLILLACVFVKFLSMQWTGGVTASASYEFSYTKSTSTTDSTGKKQTTKFTISSTKTLGAHKSAEWRIMLSKQRVTVPYTATIIAKFSAELDGFLRWGGGYNGGSPNFHVNHRGSGSRPTFK